MVNLELTSKDISVYKNQLIEIDKNLTKVTKKKEKKKTLTNKK